MRAQSNLTLQHSPHCYAIVERKKASEQCRARARVHFGSQPPRISREKRLFCTLQHQYAKKQTKKAETLSFGLKVQSISTNHHIHV